MAVTAYEHAQYSDLCWNHANFSSGVSLTKDYQSSRKQPDEDVKKTTSTIITWHNPFIDDDKLMNISSGSVATESIASGLLNAYLQGEECFKEFIVQPSSNLY